jgi:hypothetical protein
MMPRASKANVSIGGGGGVDTKILILVQTYFSNKCICLSLDTESIQISRVHVYESIQLPIGLKPIHAGFCPHWVAPGGHARHLLAAPGTHEKRKKLFFLNDLPDAFNLSQNTII